MAAGPLGLTDLVIGVDEGEFISSLASKGGDRPHCDRSGFSGLFRAFDGYFSGRPVHFNMPLAPAGSEFDKAVWKALSSIPWGKKMSYGEVASLIGRAGAARAVGGACGRNPIPLIIPCHRVLLSDGSLGGYSGGAGIKERLLGLEGIPFKVRSDQ